MHERGGRGGCAAAPRARSRSHGPAPRRADGLRRPGAARLVHLQRPAPRGRADGAAPDSPRRDGPGSGGERRRRGVRKGRRAVGASRRLRDSGAHPGRRSGARAVPEGSRRRLPPGPDARRSHDRRARGDARTLPASRQRGAARAARCRGGGRQHGDGLVRRGRPRASATPSLTATGTVRRSRFSNGRKSCGRSFPRTSAPGSTARSATSAGRCGSSSSGRLRW